MKKIKMKKNKGNTKIKAKTKGRRRRRRREEETINNQSFFVLVVYLEGTRSDIVGPGILWRLD